MYPKDTVDFFVEKQAFQSKLLSVAIGIVDHYCILVCNDS